MYNIKVLSDLKTLISVSNVMEGAKCYYSLTNLIRAVVVLFSELTKMLSSCKNLHVTSI